MRPRYPVPLQFVQPAGGDGRGQRQRAVAGHVAAGQAEVREAREPVAERARERRDGRLVERGVPRDGEACERGELVGPGERRELRRPDPDRREGQVREPRPGTEARRKDVLGQGGRQSRIVRGATRRPRIRGA